MSFGDLPQDILLAVLVEWLGDVHDVSSLDIACANREQWLSALAHPYSSFQLTGKMATAAVSLPTTLSLMQWMASRQLAVRPLTVESSFLPAILQHLPSPLPAMRLSSITLTTAHGLLASQAELEHFLLLLPNLLQLQLVQLHEVELVILLDAMQTAGKSRLQMLDLGLTTLPASWVPHLVQVLPMLTSLSILHSPLPLKSLMLLPKSLTSLQFSVNQLDLDELYTFLEYFPSIQELVLSDRRPVSQSLLTNRTLCCIVQPTKPLKTLTACPLSHSHITLSGYCHVLTCPAIEAFKMGGFEHSIQQGHATLSITELIGHNGLIKLLDAVPWPVQSLTLQGGDSFKGNSLRMLADHTGKHLTRLDLMVRGQVSAADMDYVRAHCPNLVYFSVRDVRSCATADDEWMLPSSELSLLLPMAAVCAGALMIGMVQLLVWVGMWCLEVVDFAL